MNGTLRSICLLAGAAALAAGAPPAGAWWNAAWKCRRPVTVADAKPSELPGDDVAVVTMPTGGQIRPDGGDVRVATPEDRQVPSRVLMVGPGDQVTLAFALRPRAAKYYVYFGNPQPPANPEELDLRRGVLLEMWANPGGPVRTLEQVQAVFRRTATLLGRGLRDRIWSAHNPFGPQDSIAAIYTGWLATRAEGEYVFAISSQNASFLLVDDKLLVPNGGLHGPDRQARNTGRIRLEAGLHKLTFYHVSPGGDPYAVLAWSPPGQRDRERFEFVPPAAFAPYALAAPGPMEEYGQAVSVDFLPEHRGETFMGNRYYQRYAFAALAAGRSPATIRWSWDFGDGQSSSQAACDHVFLLPGEYTIQLTGTAGAARLTRTNRLFVSRPWDRVTENVLDPVRAHADIVAKYDFGALPGGALAEAVLLLDRTRQRNVLMRAGAALVSKDQVPPRALEEALTVYADHLAAAGQADEAVAALRKGASQAKSSPAVAASMLVRSGQALLEHKNDAKGAEAAFQAVLETYAATGGAAVRAARIGLGDVWRARGDAEKARQAYEKAGALPAQRPGGEPFLKGDLARHVEEYLRTRDYESAADYLEQWAQAFPLDKLEGYWSLLRARLLVAQRRPERAIREAQELVKVNPASNYGAELLMVAYQAHQALRQDEEAKAVLRQIVKDFPESPLAAEAAKLLEGK